MKKRIFLKYLLSGAISMIAVVSGKDVLAKKYAIARSKLPVLEKKGGSVTVKLGGRPILLIRISETEIRGFEAVCTHQACPVHYEKDRIQCSCHGSHFNLRGKAVVGPATKPLTAIPVEISKDRLIVG